MPNGDPEFHSQQELELEEFFAPISHTLIDFSERHNVALEKYYHDNPSWSLLFRHPQQGVCKISIYREGPETVRIWCSWWYDSYDTATRSMKTFKGAPLVRDPQAISNQLEQVLSLALSWKPDDLDEHYPGYRTWKAMYSKEAFESLVDRYPFARP